jgi:hypothetical protein
MNALSILVAIIIATLLFIVCPIAAFVLYAVLLASRDGETYDE